MDRNDKTTELRLSTIPFLEKDVPSLCIRKTSGRKWMSYGDDNMFPQYLFELYTKSPILSSIINGTCDFVLGEGLKSTYENVDERIWNSDGEGFADIIQKMVFDYMLYGGFCLQIIYDGNGELKELYHIDLEYVRTNEDMNTIYYSEGWGKWGAKVIEYPMFDPNVKKGTSMFYYKGHISRTHTCYPTPCYISALTDIETSVEISKFHYKNVLNNFSASALVNFNNGVPSEDVQHKIENQIIDKFTGANNSGKIIVSFNDSKDTQTEITRIDEDTFDQKYQALMKSTIQNIYASFRATSNLFGYQVDNAKGFSKQEFTEAYELYAKTVVIPVQNVIIRAFDKIIGVKGSIEFIPFQLSGEKNVEEV